ncbi:hypothetical protein RhiJN_17817 [Ceratobasidium sp. AG-Ba]|nr:hypothetical protein RhiJN_17817 [Ceratobasidium sp. AG-Ba]
MLLHFRNGTNEGRWLVALITQQYLQGKPNLAWVKEMSKTKANMFADHSNYLDDYLANACTNCATRTTNNNHATSSRASTTNTRHTNRPRNQAVNHLRLQDADPPRGQSDVPRAPVPAHAGIDSSHTQSIPKSRCIPRTSNTQNNNNEARPGSEPNFSIYDHPPIPIALQVRKADKQWHQRKATYRGALQNNSPNRNLRGERGGRREYPHISPGPEAQTNAKSKSATKSQPKSSKSSTKIPPPTNRKSAQESNNEKEDLIPKECGKNDMATGSKRKAEEAGDEVQQTEQPTQKRARPTPQMCLVPSKTEDGPSPPPSDNPTGSSSNALEHNASCEVPNPISRLSDPRNVEPNKEHWSSCGEEDNKNGCPFNFDFSDFPIFFSLTRVASSTLTQLYL